MQQLDQFLTWLEKKNLQAAVAQTNGNVDVKNIILDHHENTRNEIAKLLNTSNQQVVITPSTSFGLTQVLTGLDWSNKHESGILLNDLEFSSNSFPYQQIAKKFNIPLFVLKSNKENNSEIIDLNLLESQLEENSHISLIGISHVQFINGFRTDLAKLSKIASRYKIKV